MAEKTQRDAPNRRPTEQGEAPRREDDYAFDLKRRVEAAVEGDPERLRRIARARRNKGRGDG